MRLIQFKNYSKILLCLVYIFLPIVAFAQQNTSVWIYSYLDRWTMKGDSIYGSGSFYLFQSIGTIEFEGKEYSLIEMEGEVIPTVKQRRVSAQYIPDNYLAIRYDNGRILTNRQDYMNYLSNKYSDDSEEHRYRYRVSFGDAAYVPYHQTDDGEIILYDFNMEVGDRYRHVDGYDDVYVTETGNVTLTDGNHKKLTLNNGLVLIEGIGCINSPGMLFDYLNPSSGIKHWICDLSLYLANVDEYWMENFSTITPTYKYTNPLIADRTVGIEEVSGQKEKGRRAIYNLQGQRIKTLQKGLNIVDGKKIMVK